MRTFIFVLALCVVLSSCHDGGIVPEGGLTGKTDKSVYLANESISIVISNAGDEAAYLSGCCQGLAFYVDRLESGSWHQFEGHGIPCLSMCPVNAVFLPAKQNYIDRLTLQAEGIYRLRIPFGPSGGSGMSKELTTKQFTVQ